MRVSYSVWISFFSYTVVTALSPGPNNILALSVSGKIGIKQGRNILLGIYVGFLCIMVLCGAFSEALLVIIPYVMIYMKYIGAAYTLWLEYHVAISSPEKVGSPIVDQSFWKGFFLQFVNFKIILWGITAFTSFVLPYYNTPLAIIGFILLLMLIGDGATHIWAIAGVSLSSFLKENWRVTNISVSILLLICAL